MHVYCFLVGILSFSTRRSLISVKKELNRLYILGTLITWFASYPAKSSQILKNHSIMLFTSNANSVGTKGVSQNHLLSFDDNKVLKLSIGYDKHMFKCTGS